MTDLEALQAARALITDPIRWTKSASARDAWGRMVSPLEGGAAQWTGTGALMRVSKRRTGALGIAAYSWAAIGKVDSPLLGRWEDEPTRTHGETLAAMDKAIQALSERLGETDVPR